MNFIDPSSSATRPDVPARFALAFVGLLALYLGMTAAAGWRYSVDLKVLQDVADGYPYADDLASALGDNSLLVWLVLRLTTLVNVATALYAVYIGAFALKTGLLLRLFGVVPTLAVTSLFFFSVDLNQARMSLCLSLLLLGWRAAHDGRAWQGGAWVMGATLFHYPAAASLLAFHFLARRPALTAAVTSAAAAIAAATALSESSPLARYLLYFEVTGDAGATATFYVITALLTINYARRLTGGQLLCSAVVVALSFAFRDLVNLSGRLAEVGALCVTSAALLVGWNPREHVRRVDIALLIGLAFFVYRFDQWVVSGNVPLPSNL